MPSSGTRSRICPARRRSTRAATQLEAGLRRLVQGREAGRDGVFAGVRDPLRRRASMPAPSSSCARLESKSCRPAISSSGSRRSGTGGNRHPSDRVREALSNKGSRVRSDRARGRATASPTTEYEIQQLMAGWFRDEGLVSDSDPNVSAEENAGNPHYLPTASASRSIRPTNWCCSISGASSISPVRCMRTSPGWGIPAATCPSDTSRAFAAVAAARDAAIALVQSAAAAGRSSEAGKSTAPRPPCCESAGYGDQILHRTGHSLGEDGAWQRRQHGRLRNARRSAAARRHRLHDRARRVLRRFRRPVGNQS